MSQHQHPSSELLSGFVDRELTPDELSTVETHMGSCTDCRETVESFHAMADLGPVVEESMPGEAYFLDLPDRILMQIERPEVAQPATGRTSWWNRLWSPRGGWSWAPATAAAAVLLTGAWVVVQNQSTPVETAELVDLLPAETPPDSPATTEDAEAYAGRVVYTLGSSASDLGESLDIRPGAAVTGGADGPGTQVGHQLSLGGRARDEASAVVGYGCDDGSPVERAFLAAMKAEEMGDYALAAEGYRVVRANLLNQTRDPLFFEADYRLTYVTWRSQLERMPADQKAQMLAQIESAAEQVYERWSDSQRDLDCAKALCVNRALVRLTEETAMGADTQVAQASTRVSELKPCVQE